ESQMAAVSESLRRAHPETHQDRAFQALPVEEAGIHPAIRETLNTLSIFLTLIVGAVLLLACFNVANLLLARATGRQREVGVRVALGATRRGLIRQLLVESLLLSLVGGAAGLLLATWLVSLLGRIRLPDQMPIVLEVAMDWRVLAFSLGLAVFTGLLFGLAPALEATRPDVAQAIKGSASPRRLRRFSLRNLLVVGQVAASLVLLIGAGLFLRSLGRLEGIDPGFDTDQVLLVPLDLESLGYEPPQLQAFYDRLAADVARLPEVSAVSVAETVPLGFERSSVTIQQPETGQQEKVDYNVVSPDYFRTLGIPLLGGRDFGPQDRVGAPGVVIVNETLARRFWPGQEAVGRSVSDGVASYQVVAVARDSKYRFLGEEPTPYLYVPLGQELHGEVVLHVRSSGDPLRLAGPVRSQVESLEPRLQGLDPRSLEGQLSFALLPGRISGIVFIVFGLVALGLACMGIYGVMSHSVHQRRREMAIRMSVGARPEDVRRMVLRESMTLVAVGMGLGLLVALPVMQFVGSFLYGVTSTDPVSFAGVIVVLAAAAALASYFPARRATRFDPMLTMRQE
ncbi:MAG TPA: ADOP family duplicated permease, partial [Thermoanaerobaculia bacterium]|nr:ADOP family duplicated permease [Thermoanaerobaculia bacterium]